MTNGNLGVINGIVECPITTLGGSNVRFSNGSFFTGTITLDGSTGGSITNCYIDTSTDAAIVFDASGTVEVSTTTIKSTAVPCVQGTGGGGLEFCGCNFLDDTNIAGTLSGSLDFSNKSLTGGLSIGEKTNPTMGIVTLVAGTATILTNRVNASSRIYLTHQTNAGVPGFVSVTARVAGTSFTITSANAGDTSDIAWLLVEPV